MEAKATILIVDDDPAMTSMLAEVLEAEGYMVLTANSGGEALALIRQAPPELVISDLRMSGMNGHQLQSEIKRLCPDLPVVIITGFGSIETAVESMRRGAFDFITKPFTNNELINGRQVARWRIDNSDRNCGGCAVNWRAATALKISSLQAPRCWSCSRSFRVSATARPAFC